MKPLLYKSAYPDWKSMSIINQPEVYQYLNNCITIAAPFIAVMQRQHGPHDQPTYSTIMHIYKTIINILYFRSNHFESSADIALPL